jgi:predicted Holliday junction resolvase-like endonuclease
MIIDTGKYIKCVFKNGTVIEGIVKQWTAGDVQLQSLQDQSIMIILHPEDDIMLIKIMPDISSATVEKTDQTSPLKEEIIAKLEEVQATAENPELQKESLKDLRNMVVNQEKQIIANKIKEHFPTQSSGKTNYNSQADTLFRGRGGR